MDTLFLLDHCVGVSTRNDAPRVRHLIHRDDETSTLQQGAIIHLNKMSHY